MYAVKIVCVPTLGRASPALVPGIYRTAVNVHNPWPLPAHIIKWVTLSPPQGQAAISGERISETLEPFQAFDIDCVHIAKDFGLQGQHVPGGKGFLIIQADQDIDVVGVYSAEGTGRQGQVGVGLGMDVEYIQPKIGPALPVLTVTPPPSTWQASTPTFTFTPTATPTPIPVFTSTPSGTPTKTLTPMP